MGALQDIACSTICPDLRSFSSQAASSPDAAGGAARGALGAVPTLKEVMDGLELHSSQARLCCTVWTFLQLRVAAAWPCSSCQGVAQ